MKKILSFILGLIILFSLTNCKQSADKSSDNSVSYHDLIMGYHSNIAPLINIFSNAVWDTTYNVKDLVDVYNNCQTVVKDNLKNLENIEALKDDPGLKNSVIQFNNVINDVLNNEYLEILSFYQKEKWLPEYNKAINEILQTSFNKISTEEKELLKMEKTYAEEYNIKLL